MTRRDNITRWRAKGLWMDVLELLGVCHIEPKGSRTGNPLEDHVFLGARTAVAYKTESSAHVDGT